MQQITGRLERRFAGIQVSNRTNFVRATSTHGNSPVGSNLKHVLKFSDPSFVDGTWAPNRQKGRCGSTRGDKQRGKFDEFFDETTIEAFIPLLGYIALIAVGAPLLGIALPAIGIAGLVICIAFITGQVTKISTTYGISPINTAVAIAGVVFSVLAIPALLKLGIFLLAGLFMLNFASNFLGTNNFRQSEDIDASNAIIDVDYESVDD